jgi:signal transduction histidine kinase
MAYLGFVMTTHIKENAIHRVATATALHMDSFVERHVQALAASSALSEEQRQALEKLLSPAAAHKPIVAFRIWKGDTIVFSNERELVGKTFARTPARERAWLGQMAVEFEQPDGDDDEQVRSLNLPILEVYAPVRERGTGRIIALVETYEIGVELRNEVRNGQMLAWTAIAGITLLVVMLQFSFVNKIAELSRLRAESEQRRQRISHANLQVSEMNERSLQRVGNDLCNGPAQYLALALLRFDGLDKLVSGPAEVGTPLLTDGHRQDLEIIRKALDDALCDTRRVAGGLLPRDLEHLSVAETFARATRRHERRTGTAVRLETQGLPEQLSFPVKACLYHFATESLDRISAVANSQPQRISVSCDDEQMALEIVSGPIMCTDPHSFATSARFGSLRDRIEAVGGNFRLIPDSAGGLLLVAELKLADMELARG